MQTRCKPRHVHKYQRKILGKNYPVYACVLPECNHYLGEQFIVGKLSICNRCGETTIIKRERDGTIRHRPHCKDCTKQRVNNKPTSKTNKLLANLLAGSPITTKLPDV